MNALIMGIVAFQLLLVIFAFFIFVVFKGVGVKNAFTIFKLRNKRRKGWGLCKIYQRTGFPVLIPLKFEEMLIPFGDSGGKYIYKKNCVYYNEYDIPTIEYYEGEAEPINPYDGLQSTVSPNVLESTIAKAIKAEQGILSPFDEWLKKNRGWLYAVGMFILVVMGIMGFIIVQQNDTITSLTIQTAKQVITAGTELT